MSYMSFKAIKAVNTSHTHTNLKEGLVAAFMRS